MHPSCLGAFVRGMCYTPGTMSAVQAQAVCQPCLSAGRPAAGVKRGVQGLRDKGWQTYSRVIRPMFGPVPTKGQKGRVSGAKVDVPTARLCAW